MNIRDIETILIVEKTKNISKAASLLYSSQPSVSQRINSVEKEFGFKIFKRGRGLHNIELTDEGKEFLPYAEECYDLLLKMQEISLKSEEIKLKIGTIGSLRETLVFPICNMLMSDSNESSFDFTIKTNWSSVLYEQLSSGQLDIAFVDELYDYPNIHVEPLYEERFLVLKQRDTEKCGVMTIHPSELDAKDEIFINWSKEFDEWHSKWWPSHIKRVLNTDEISGVHLLFTKKGNWAIVPYIISEHLVNTMQFDSFEISEGPNNRKIYMLWNNKSFLSGSKSNRIRQFSTFFREYVFNISDKLK